MLTRTDNNGSSFVFDSSSLKNQGDFDSARRQRGEGCLVQALIGRKPWIEEGKQKERKKERIRNCADKKGDGWIDGWNLERKRNYGGADEEQRRMKKDREKEKGGGGGDGKIEARSPRGELQNCL